jgi:DNA repair protein RadC
MRRKRRDLSGLRITKPDVPPYGLGAGAEAVQSCSPSIKPGRRISLCVTRPDKPGPRIIGPLGICELFNEAKSSDRESMYTIHLDAHQRVIGIEEVAKGTLTAVETSAREVFKSAFLSNANSIIMVHNHPSGVPESSPADENFTRRFVEVGKLLGVPVLDHVIVGAEGCLSMREKSGGGVFNGVRERGKKR